MFLKKKGDLILGVAATVLAVVIFVMSSQLPPNLLGGVGSDFMPKIVAIGMGILGVLQVIFSLLGGAEMQEITEVSEEDKPEYNRVLATVVLFGIYVFTLEKVGFLICSIVYLFLQMVVLATEEKRNYLLFAVISVVFNIVVYFLFRNGLNVMLPAGILG